MVQLSRATGLISLKFVYAGPRGAGKTSNLAMAAQFLAERPTVEPLGASGERLTITVAGASTTGCAVSVQLYATSSLDDARAVFAGADGVAFVVDARPAHAAANEAAWQALRHAMDASGLSDVPVVVQHNKHDLMRPGEQPCAFAEASPEAPPFKAVAIRGQGVAETLFAMSKLAYRRLDARHDVARTFGLTETGWLRGLFRKMAPKL